MPSLLPWLPPRDEALWPAGLAGLRAATGPAAWAQLTALAGQQLGPLETARLDRELTRLLQGGPPPASLEPVRVAVLASSTTRHLLPSLRIGGLRRGLLLEIFEAPFGQYLQEVLEPSAGLIAFAPEAVLLLLDSRHIAELHVAGAEALHERLEELWRVIHERWGAAVIHSTALPLEGDLLGSNEHRAAGSSPAAGSAPEAVAAYNHWLRAAADRAGVHLLALDRAAALAGLDAWHDPALWHLAKQEIHPAAAPLFGDLVARVLAALRGRSRKCLVLDLDNTLWRGTVGDDGPHGIEVGQGSASGEAHLAFQHFAAALRRRGVLLAVSSKNDPELARAAFRTRPGLPLTLESFDAFQANWDDKPSNLRRIAQDLNLSLDALVFADDNPAERALVRRELPEVAVPELGADPSQFVSILSRAGYFEAVLLTPEDARRAGQYAARSAAEAARPSAQNATDLRGFLDGLAMQAELRPFDEANLPRIVQLANKTNQWNLTGRRLTPELVRAWMGDPCIVTLQVTLCDRFGDHGTVALLAGRLEASPSSPSAVHLLLWAMSCRVFGRELEHLCRNTLLQTAQARGVRSVLAPFEPTAKNGLLRERLAALGFVAPPLPAGLPELWSLSAGAAPLQTAVAATASLPLPLSPEPPASSEIAL